MLPVSREAIALLTMESDCHRCVLLSWSPTGTADLGTAQISNTKIGIIKKTHSLSRSSYPSWWEIQQHTFNTTPRTKRATWWLTLWIYKTKSYLSSGPQSLMIILNKCLLDCIEYIGKYKQIVWAKQLPEKGHAKEWSQWPFEVPIIPLADMGKPRLSFMSY